MQHLVCWTLMGMRSTGGIEVWYQLGSFQTENSAVEAAASGYWPGQGFQKVSVVPYYRVDRNVTPGHSSAEPAARTSAGVGEPSHTAV